jgi:hypothetical protein
MTYLAGTFKASISTSKRAMLYDAALQTYSSEPSGRSLNISKICDEISIALPPQGMQPQRMHCCKILSRGSLRPARGTPRHKTRERSLGCAIVRSCKSDRGEKFCRCSRASTSTSPVNAVSEKSTDLEVCCRIRPKPWFGTCAGLGPFVPVSWDHPLSGPWL